MKGRQDSLAAAAELMVSLEALCTLPLRQGGPDPADNLVCTVGELKVWPGASNVIPGSTGFSIDVRAKGDAVRERTVHQFTQALQVGWRWCSMRCPSGS